MIQFDLRIQLEMGSEKPPESPNFSQLNLKHQKLVIFWSPIFLRTKKLSTHLRIEGEIVKFFEFRKSLGGGFKHFLFSPLFGEDFQFEAYFSDGLVQPPTRSC